MKTRKQLEAARDDDWQGRRFSRNKKGVCIMKESIRDMLSDAFDDLGNFDEVNFVRVLERAGCRSLAPFITRHTLYALAAAIEYYDGDIEQARATIDAGDYRHYPDAQTYEELGGEILREETNVDRLPQIVLDYMDFEALGRDVAGDAERGKFTHFGYFAPEKW